jgi:hypothetical protein
MLLVSALLTALISPLGSALALGLLALLLSLTRWRRAAALTGLTGMVWLTAWSLPVTANWIQAHVSRNQRSADCRHANRRRHRAAGRWRVAPHANAALARSWRSV